MNTVFFTLLPCAMALLLGGGWLPAAEGADGKQTANTWTTLVGNEVNPRTGAGLVWHPKLKRFVLFGGLVSHEFTGESGYQVQSIDLDQSTPWQNDLPEGGQGWGERTGKVSAPGFSTPYFQMLDKAGVVRPSPRHMLLHYQYALAPWDGCIYMLASGHLLRYDPVGRIWTELEPQADTTHGLPAQPAPHHQSTLNWGALAADPINQEIVLFGGCGVTTENGSPGTWVYSTVQNQWRKVVQKTEPSSRALSPLAFDAATGKIVLFGGDLLDGVAGDTWAYDCKLRSWSEQKPPLGPAPRFGHVLLPLPTAPGKLLLAGGNTINSSTAYQANLYQPLPFEFWVYDIAQNRWDVLKRFAGEEVVPQLVSNNSNVAALDDRGRLLFVGAGKKRFESATYVATINSAQRDPAGTQEFGVPTGTITRRSGPYDPEWYLQDIPPVDAAQTANNLATLVPNRWTPLAPPKWPTNRQGGGWSTVAYDSDGKQLLHLGGGHSSYFGNDVAHYDTLADRWSISYRPQFALQYNYDLSGPGSWAFNGGPWGNHNYHAYQYDPVRQRLVYVRNAYTHFYDPLGRVWKQDELIRDNPFTGSKYTSYLVSTPEGVVVWANELGSGLRHGIFLLTKEGWRRIETTGETLPKSETDGSTISFDENRKQLLLTTTLGEKGIDHSGQVWSVELSSGAVKKLNPGGREKIVVKRFAREAVFLPKRDLVLIGYHLGGETNQIPFYDVAGNRWLTAELPGSEFFSRTGAGASVDLGLIYDRERELIWAVMCKLQSSNDLQVLQIDEKLKLSPVE